MLIVIATIRHVARYNGFVLLVIAVDTAIALLQPVGVEGQLHVDQVVAAVVVVPAWAARPTKTASISDRVGAAPTTSPIRPVWS